MRFLALFASMLSATVVAADVPDAYVQSCEPATFPQRACIQAPVGTASLLAIGQKTIARVDAQCWWNRTGVLLEPAGVYEVEVTGRIEAWRDAGLETIVAPGLPAGLPGMGGPER